MTVLSWYEPNEQIWILFPILFLFPFLLFIFFFFFGLVLCCILVNRCKYVMENERFGTQSVAKRLFKFEVFCFLFFFLHLITALSCHMSQIGTFLPSTITCTYCRNAVISHIGKTCYCCPVLPTFSIKFFFRVDLKHFCQSHGLVWFLGRFLNTVALWHFA